MKVASAGIQSVQSLYTAALVLLLRDSSRLTLPGIPNRLWFKQQVSLTQREAANLQPRRPCFSAPCLGLNGFNSRGKKAGWTWGELEGARDYWREAQGCGKVGWGSLWVLGGGGGGGGGEGWSAGEALVKHRCLVVWSDPPPWTLHRRLISSSSEQGSKGEPAVLRGPTSRPLL